MREPEILRALPDLTREGWIAEPATTTVRRLAVGELVSVRAELRFALYVGVLLLVSGVSWFVKDNVDRLGPATIAIAGALIVAGLFFWILRRAEPFSWDERASGHLAFDFLLLLAALLAAADLAFVENRFTPLGDSWTYHLLIVALGYGALAVRFDSKLLFSLALSTFAAWRGLSVGLRDTGRWLGFGASADALRWNALFCGVLFVVLGTVMKRSGRKAHFEPTAAVLGWILIFAALLSGQVKHFEESFGVGALWALAAFATGLGLAAGSVRSRRFGLFSLGAGAAYLGFLGLTLPLLPNELIGLFGCFGTFGSAVAAVAGLVLAHQRWFREPSPGARP
jgi:uncharacterized membrane-anchored protein